MPSKCVFGLVLVCLGTALSPFGPVRLGWHGHGLSPLASLEPWTLLHALLDLFSWFGTFSNMISELTMYAICPCLFLLSVLERCLFMLKYWIMYACMFVCTFASISLAYWPLFWT